MILINILIIAVFIHFLVWAYGWLRFSHTVLFMKEVSSPKTSETPLISVIFAAKDEGKHVEKTVRGLLKQTYPHFELIAVNDRSEDETGLILTTLAQTHPHLKTIHIKELPSGWIGKNHALLKGAQAAKGQWLLFTDGDVKFHPQVLSEALAYATQKELDHLVSFPILEAQSILEQATLLDFLLLSTFVIQPWRIRSPQKQDAMGIGAFNFIRRDAYKKIGTHAAFPLSVVDDVELGRLIKKHKFRSDVLLGQDRLWLKWQENVNGIVKGLEKNFFAGFRFSKWALLFGTASLFVLSWTPILALFHPNPWMKAVGGVTLLLNFLVFLKSRRFQPSSLGAFPLLPLGMTLICFSMIRSMVFTLRRGGIQWRDTFYPLSMFKKPSLKDGWDALRGNY